MDSTVVDLETALDRVGFGLYSYLLLILTGLIIISFSFVVYGNTVLIPLSACDLNITRWQQGLLAAMPSIGIIVGAIFWGYLGDTRGRRRMLLVSLIWGALFNAVSCLSGSWLTLLVTQTVASVIVAGQYPLSMTLLSECVPFEKRSVVIILVTSIFLFSQGLMAVIAMPIAPLGYSIYLPWLDIYWSPWRTIALTYSAPSLICFIWMYYMQDSPKFVLEYNNSNRALAILNAIYRINNPRSKKVLQVTALTTKVNKEDTTKLTIMGRLKPFIKKPLRKKVILITTVYALQLMWPFKVWLPTIANQFMTILETGQGTDMTLCRIIHLSLQTPSEKCALNTTALSLVLIACTIQSVWNLILSAFVNRLGRRNMVVLITSLCGLCGMCVNIIPNAYISACMFSIQLVGMICLGYYTAIAVSIFPTAFRAMGVTIAVTGNRLSMFMCIQVLNYMLQHYCEVGFFVFCMLFVLSSMITTMLPEERRPRPSIAHSIMMKSQYLLKSRKEVE